MLEEVARHGRPLSCSPDTDIIRKIFRPDFLDGISSFVCGEHDTRRGCTMFSPGTEVNRLIFSEVSFD